MIIEIDDLALCDLLEVLRLAPVYALLGSQDQRLLGDDFKSWKFSGHEKDFAKKTAKVTKKLRASIMTAAEKEVRGA